MGKNLVVYFSESGNTQKFAEIIHKQVGGDIKRIEPVKEYPKTSYQDLADYAENEKKTNARPEYKDLGINLDGYDNIFVGYPMWWYTLPMIMYKFFEDYDFSGKTLIPFNTHEGSGDGGTYETIKELEPNVAILEGLPIRGGDLGYHPDSDEINVSDQTETVKNWLTKIGF